MAMARRVVPVFLSSSRHMSRALLSPYASTAAAADQAFLRVASPSANPRFTSSAWKAPAIVPPAASDSACLGLAGSLSFSMALVTVAEAKEPLSPELLPKEVVLYQYEACPFCNKVKAFLDYHDIPYKVVEVNPLSKKEIKWSEYKKVPILVVDGEQLVNSSDIMKSLSSRIHPEKSVLDSDEEINWFRWVDEHLVHMLSPNIYRNASEALESFDYITKNAKYQNKTQEEITTGMTA